MKPVKPFENYRWRWLHVQPTEGLLKPPVYLGVLRALNDCQGDSFSSNNLHARLCQVESDFTDSVGLIKLARTPERNLFRNSKQYWTGTGLLEKTSGVIRLSQLGLDLASGQCTQDEFAAHVIENTVLPNFLTYGREEIESWRNANLEIKPFLVILEVMGELGKKLGQKAAYITPNELIKIIIPLAGVRCQSEEIASCIDSHRNNMLDISSWPNCAPGANDQRLAKEFLLFLMYYGVCTAEHQGRTLYDSCYSFAEVDNLYSANGLITQQGRHQLPLLIQRNRTTTSRLSRSGQLRFRQDVFAICEGRCLITQEATTDVLEAAHIIPVEYGGQDIQDNGICLRVDIHRIFDSGKLRILHDGQVVLHSDLQNSASYSRLPNYVNVRAGIQSRLQWRNNYL